MQYDKIDPEEKRTYMELKSANIFKVCDDSLFDTLIEISDGYIRINAGISTDIRYEGNFTLKQVSECLRDIIKYSKNLNGSWVKSWEYDLQIAVEFDDTEDSCNLCIITGVVYITLSMKASALPELIQFFYNNHE
jgi:hypothetical protein